MADRSATQRARPLPPHTVQITGMQVCAFLITVEDGIALTAARATSSDIRRHNASNYG